MTTSKKKSPESKAVRNRKQPSSPKIIKDEEIKSINTSNADKFATPETTPGEAAPKLEGNPVQNAMTTIEEGLSTISAAFVPDEGLADLRLAGDEIKAVTDAAQRAAITGFQALSEEMQSFARTSLENGIDGARLLFEARSLPELFEAQQKLMLDGLGACTDHMRRLGAIGVETVEKLSEPATDHMTASIGKLWRPNAA